MNHIQLMQKTMKEIHESIPKGKVLDAGCRDNGLKQFFTDLGFEWYGCDVKSNIEEQKADTDVLFCDMSKKLPYKDSFFSLVFSCHSFEHVENPSQTLREFKRVAMCGGFIFIVMPMFNKKYIVEADNDHISVMHPMQMERLCYYVGGLKPIRSWQEPHPSNPEINNQNYLIQVEK